MFKAIFSHADRRLQTFKGLMGRGNTERRDENGTSLPIRTRQHPDSGAVLTLPELLAKPGLSDRLPGTLVSDASLRPVLQLKSMTTPFSCVYRRAPTSRTVPIMDYESVICHHFRIQERLFLCHFCAFPGSEYLCSEK